MSVLDRSELEQSPLADLHAIAAELGLEGFRRMRKAELIGAILSAQGGEGGGEPAPPEGAEDAPAAEDPAPEEIAEAPPVEEEAAPAAAEGPTPGDEEIEVRPRREEREPDEVRSGTLDILPNGSGFLRSNAFAHSRDDIYVSPAQIRRCELRSGDELSGPVRPPRRSERHPSLVRVETVNGGPAEPPQERPSFTDLPARFATERLPGPEGLEAAPFGKGSRVAVAGPPGAGATTLLRQIIGLLRGQRPDMAVGVVLAGVRPEEVEEWQALEGVTVAGGGADRAGEEHAQAADMAVQMAKRAVETGRDAALVIDSLDALPASAARRAFGAARNAEGGGTLTVFAAVAPDSDALRIATTRIVLVPAAAPGQPPTLAAGLVGTVRAELLA